MCGGFPCCRTLFSCSSLPCYSDWSVTLPTFPFSLGKYSLEWFWAQRCWIIYKWVLVLYGPMVTATTCILFLSASIVLYLRNVYEAVPYCGTVTSNSGTAHKFIYFYLILFYFIAAVVCLSFAWLISLYSYRHSFKLNLLGNLVCF